MRSNYVKLARIDVSSGSSFRVRPCRRGRWM